MSDFLVESVLRGVLGGRKKKKSKKALKYLTGHGKGAGFVNPTTLLTAAGVAWGIYETMQNQGGQFGTAGAGMPQAGAGPAGAGMPPAGAGLKTGPYMESALPPLPNIGAATAPPLPIDDVTRVIRLAVSAANADGSLHEQERAAIAQQAGPDAAEIVARELEIRRPLAEIVTGVGDPAKRATLYVLAYTILRADEQVSGAERIYLAQLAHLLGLDPATVQKLEADTSQRIDEE
jgi:uncharacterized membrane protein YebE (DUF533 family)